MTQSSPAPYIPFAEAIAVLASRLHIHADEMQAYADADLYGGRDDGTFQAMAIHAVEGRLLYALVRALKPQTVLEIGTADGGSATHILSALATNGIGQLISYDVVEGSGGHIPAALRDRWTLRIEDALTADLPQADYIFEDSDHSLDFSIALFGKLKALNPRIIGTHDYNSHEIYPVFAVKQAFDTVFPDNLPLKLQDAFTGMAWWVNDNWEPEVIMPVKPPPLSPRKPAAKKPAPAKRTAKR
jgi:hypothetical protein